MTPCEIILQRISHHIWIQTNENENMRFLATYTLVNELLGIFERQISLSEMLQKRHLIIVLIGFLLEIFIFVSLFVGDFMVLWNLFNTRIIAKWDHFNQCRPPSKFAASKLETLTQEVFQLLLLALTRILKKV